ncbi:hypothetical protein [Dactylosporangium sp. CA-139066]|uniref:hypothetical protein n=1 Tax=Dactylosporangium sp. CA-139066 TaxID=3239930 RepID=UPI003D8B1A3E
MRGTTRTRHTYTRPRWICDVDGEPWPCSERRAVFLEKYDGRQPELERLMGMFLADAAADLTGESPPMLRERFTGWIGR